MKQLLTICLLFAILALHAQQIPVMEPETGFTANLSPEGEKEYYLRDEKCKALLAKRDTATLTAEEEELLADYNYTEDDYYDIIGNSCSWYCGGGYDSVIVSSTLPPHDTLTYVADNAADLSFKTAWIEGAKGNGVGEYIVYHFAPQCPRITEVIVVNGYVKSPTAWQQNNRVKKLKMYLNNVPVAILNLNDNRYTQHFKFKPIGNNNRNEEALKNAPPFTLKFEILEVYPGTKHNHTALTEIYFDGIDVHWTRQVSHIPPYGLGLSSLFKWEVVEDRGGYI